MVGSDISRMNGKDPNYYPDDEEEFNEVGRENGLGGQDDENTELKRENGVDGRDDEYNEVGRENGVEDRDEVVIVLNQQEKKIQEQRDGARKSQQKQAEKMKKATNNRFINL